MGKVVEKVKLTSLFEPEKSVEVEAVIDTGATMVVLPRDREAWIKEDARSEGEICEQ